MFLPVGAFAFFGRSLGRALGRPAVCLSVCVSFVCNACIVAQQYIVEVVDGIVEIFGVDELL